MSKARLLNGECRSILLEAKRKETGAEGGKKMLKNLIDAKSI